MRLHARLQKLERCIPPVRRVDAKQIRVELALQALSIETLEHLKKVVIAETSGKELSEVELHAWAFNEAFAAVEMQSI
jgi:hypothetical protein